MKNIEKHHLIFYISTIVVFFLIEKLFTNQVRFLTQKSIGIIFYIVILTFLTSLLFIIVSFGTILNLLGARYHTENPLSSNEIFLTIPVIVTSFIIDDLYNLLRNYTIDFSIILTIILIPFIYLLIYKLNEWFLINMFQI